MQMMQSCSRTVGSQALPARSSTVARVMGGMGPPGMGGAPPGVGKLAVDHDPEALFKGIPVKSGIIQRRMMTKQMEQDKDFAKAMSAASDELRKEQLLRRQARRPPANHEEMVEYFLNTLAEDLEYEVARYRPRLTPDFFQYLDSVLGAERFSEKPDEDRLAELDLLRRYLAEAADAVDRCVAATSSAKDRMMKLLTAKDKKAMILDMAGANEIDQALMDLLQQNIEAAKAAGQEEPAQFMEKVKQACSKYLIATPATQPALPAVPAQLGARPENPNIPIIGATTAGTEAAAAPAAPAAPPAGGARQPAKTGGLILDPKNPDPSGMKQAGRLLL